MATKTPPKFQQKHQLAPNRLDPPPPKPINKLAGIVIPEQKAGQPVPDLEIEGYETTQVVGDLTPTAEFKVPGEYIYGEYLGMRTIKIKTRDQTLYDLKRPDNGDTVSVWGSTILDNRMKRAGFEIGEGIYIRYLGVVETAGGLSPAKNFEIGRLTVKGK